MRRAMSTILADVMAKTSRAMEQNTKEIEAIDEEIARQEEWRRIELDSLDAHRAKFVEEGAYTIDRLKYRRSLLAGEVAEEFLADDKHESKADTVIKKFAAE